MQAHQPKGSAEQATTARYDTIVIRGATGKAVPKEVDGGEVVSWSSGHDLAAMDALLELVEDLAAGDCSYPAELTERANQTLALMKRRREQGWDDDEQSHAPQLEVLQCGWSKTKPIVPGAYWIRGFRLFEATPGLPALVDVRLDGADLISNMHMHNSEDCLRQWSLVADISEKFEWLGPLEPMGGY